VAFLGPPMGPTLDRIIERWLRVWRSNRLLRYEALDEAAARSAGELCFGRTDLPVYQLDAADVLVSFGADFLETWRSPVELTRQYAAFRAPRVGREGITMGRAVYVGPRFGVTAAKSDEQLRVRPGDEVLIALSILQHLAARRLLQPGVDLEAVGAFTAGYAPAVVSQRTGVPAATIQRVAEWFGNSGTAVALAGTADTATHVTASVLNAVTGNIGKTVRYREGPRSTACSPPSDIAALLDALRVGAVDVLVVADAVARALRRMVRRGTGRNRGARTSHPAAPPRSRDLERCGTASRRGTPRTTSDAAGLFLVAARRHLARDGACSGCIGQHVAVGEHAGGRGGHLA
jgi:hypothetical protein